MEELSRYLNPLPPEEEYLLDSGSGGTIDQGGQVSGSQGDRAFLDNAITHDNSWLYNQGAHQNIGAGVMTNDAQNDSFLNQVVPANEPFSEYIGHSQPQYYQLQPPPAPPTSLQPIPMSSIHYNNYPLSSHHHHQHHQQYHPAPITPVHQPQLQHPPIYTGAFSAPAPAAPVLQEQLLIHASAEVPKKKGRGRPRKERSPNYSDDDHDGDIHAPAQPRKKGRPPLTKSRSPDSDVEPPRKKGRPPKSDQKKQRRPSEGEDDEDDENWKTLIRLGLSDEKFKFNESSGHLIVMDTAKGFDLMDHFQKNGFEKPILFKDPEGLGIVKPKCITPQMIQKHIPRERKVDVVHVNKERSVQRNVGFVVDYYMAAKSKRAEISKGILNMLSLEYSLTTLADKVKGPEIVKSSLDWVEHSWPRQLLRQTNDPKKETSDLYPKVQNYCLVSVDGCFTNFHIDFGGTSVWYHITKGKKVFWLIPPTERNLRAYQEWSKDDEKEEFLGYKVDCCIRVELEQNYTVFLPSGWIHAVYTPVDSIVFGGNFLHLFSVDMQLKVHEGEAELKVPAKFRYPHFTGVHWYMADKLVQKATGEAKSKYLDEEQLKPEIYAAVGTYRQPIETEGHETEEQEMQMSLAGSSPKDSDQEHGYELDVDDEEDDEKGDDDDDDDDYLPPELLKSRIDARLARSRKSGSSSESDEDEPPANPSGGELEQQPECSVKAIRDEKTIQFVLPPQNESAQKSFIGSSQQQTSTYPPIEQDPPKPVVTEEEKKSEQSDEPFLIDELYKAPEQWDIAYILSITPRELDGYQAIYDYLRSLREDGDETSDRELPYGLSDENATKLLRDLKELFAIRKRLVDNPHDTENVLRQYRIDKKREYSQELEELVLKNAQKNIDLRQRESSVQSASTTSTTKVDSPTPRASPGRPLTSRRSYLDDKAASSSPAASSRSRSRPKKLELAPSFHNQKKEITTSGIKEFLSSLSPDDRYQFVQSCFPEFFEQPELTPLQGSSQPIFEILESLNRKFDSTDGTAFPENQAKLAKVPANFVCKMCSESLEFPSSQQYTQHTIRHLQGGLAPYECYYCREEFLSQTQCGQHMTAKHPDQPEKMLVQKFDSESQEKIRRFCRFVDRIQSASGADYQLPQISNTASYGKISFVPSTNDMENPTTDQNPEFITWDQLSKNTNNFQILSEINADFHE